MVGAPWGPPATSALRQRGACRRCWPTVTGGFGSGGACPLPLAPDLRPAIGMADRRGGFVVAGVGMTVGLVLGAADLLAAYLAGAPLPGYAPAFVPGRFGPLSLRPPDGTTSRVDF